MFHGVIRNTAILFHYKQHDIHFVYKLFNIYNFPGSVSTLLGKVVNLRQMVIGK